MTTSVDQPCLLFLMLLDDDVPALVNYEELFSAYPTETTVYLYTSLTSIQHKIENYIHSKLVIHAHIVL